MARPAAVGALRPERYRRLREIAEARSVSMSRCVRQLVDEAAVDPAPSSHERETLPEQGRG
jgi:predicted DNA-binding ribbon-helix-helix protein